MQDRNLHVLVAEDHEFQRHTLVEMLQLIGISEITEATNGRLALEILERQTPEVDIIVSDLDMPEMDGMEFIRHIGDTRRQVSIILSSALDRALIGSVETITKAYGINLLGVIEKPPTLCKLEELVARHRELRNGRPKPPRMEPMPLEEIVDGLDEHQFEPYFQPKVDLATGQIVGAEALARWHHPSHGLIAPARFIPVIEGTEACDELTKTILSQSAAICRDWHAGGLPIHVSVNLSITSLSAPTFADRVLRLVQAAGAEPKMMILEVTETVAMTEIAKALENLVRLRMKGFSLAIDDYGTGYSSLQQLSRVPFNELKVDQYFVATAVDDPGSRVMLQSSLEMAERLGLVSVAEGIETQATWDLLRDLHCNLAQGFFIAKPMPASAFRDWAEDWRP